MSNRVHFRDCKAWIGEGLGMTTTSDQAVKLYDHALHQVISHTPDLDNNGIMGTINLMMEADNNLVMGKVFSLGLKSMQLSSRLSNKVKESVKELSRLQNESNLNERERLHCKAMIEWANENNSKACRIWEDILISYPRDLLALELSFHGNLTFGNSVMLRDNVARVIPYWKKSDPYYGYLLSRLAFGLEETNRFAEAEKLAIEGLALIPDDSFGIHARSHIFDATSRYKECKSYLLDSAKFWNVNNTFTCHNYWHLLITLLEYCEYETALEVYDQHIVPAFKKSGYLFNINDGCQSLQRLELEGVNVGDRWEELYASYESHLHDHLNAYDDVHMLMSFVKSKTANKCNVENKFMASVKKYVNDAKGDNRLLTQEVGMDMFNAIIAYNEKRFSDVVNLLYPIKNQIVSIGGSHVQRDLFDQILLNACLQSKSVKHHDLGRGLLYERKLLKPESLHTDRLLDRMMSCHFNG